MKTESTVQVLMSTYNGEKYLIQQVESILDQQNIDIQILIRDDGSTDGTLQLIKELARKYPQKIKFYSGKNIGYKRSFMDLLNKASDRCDYYAFADQDDIWKNNKLSIAVDKLNIVKYKYKLYASTVWITDANLKVLYKKDIDNFVNTFGSVLSRIRLAGCTYVFNRELLRIVKKIDFKTVKENQRPSHDGMVFTICKAIDGYVYVDKNAYILHRRRNSSVTSGGNGVIKRVKHEYNLTFNSKDNVSFFAEELVSKLSDFIPRDNKLLLEEILNYKKKLKYKIKLLNDKKLDTGMFWANLEAKIRIILGLF